MVMLVGVNPAWYVLNNILKDNNTCGKLGIPEMIAYCFFCSTNPAFVFYWNKVDIWNYVMDLQVTLYYFAEILTEGSLQWFCS